MPAVRLALTTHPDAAVFTGTMGLALIFLEFNRPGRIFPAAVGLLLLLLAIAGLLQAGAQRSAVGLLMAGASVPLLNAWRRVPIPLLGIAAATVVVGLKELLPRAAPVRIHFVTAVVCGGFLSVAGALLTSVAYRARRAKALD